MDWPSEQSKLFKQMKGGETPRLEQQSLDRKLDKLFAGLSPYKAGHFASVMLEGSVSSKVVQNMTE